jgi:hypothetical protein
MSFRTSEVKLLRLNEPIARVEIPQGASSPPDAKVFCIPQRLPTSIVFVLPAPGAEIDW